MLLITRTKTLLDFPHCVILEKAVRSVCRAYEAAGSEAYGDTRGLPFHSSLAAGSCFAAPLTKPSLRLGPPQADRHGAMTRRAATARAEGEGNERSEWQPGGLSASPRRKRRFTHWVKAFSGVMHFIGRHYNYTSRSTDFSRLKQESAPRFEPRGAEENYLSILRRYSPASILLMLCAAVRP